MQKKPFRLYNIRMIRVLNSLLDSIELHFPAPFMHKYFSMHEPPSQLNGLFITD